MFEEQLLFLIDRWKKTFGTFDRRKTEAERTVIRLEWATGERYSHLPYHFQRFPGRGRVLKAAPVVAGNFFQYGFDEQGRALMHRYFPYRPGAPANFINPLTSQSNITKALFSETFYEYFDDLIEIVEFSVYPHIPLRIQHIYFENNRVSFYGSFKLNGYTPLYGNKAADPDHLYEWLGYNGRFKIVEAYTSVQERLMTITGYYEAPGISPYIANEQFFYDETGKLLRIERMGRDGHKQAVYQRRSKGQSFKAVREGATQKLIQSIVQRIKAANIQERVYCVDLFYQRVIKHFPPGILPLPERYRLQLLQSGDPAARYNIFCPIFDEWFLEIDDPETLEICQLLEQEIQAGEKWDTATHILRDVATGLTRQDWRGILNVTPDFVVFALDPEMEGDQLGKALSSSVSRTQIREWIEKGWLP